MSDHHHHHHDHSGPIAIGATAAKVVVGLLAAIGVVVVAGLIWLWPSAQHIDIPLPMQNGGGGAVQTEAGTVVRQDIGPCGSSSNGRVFADEPQAPRANGYTCQRSIVTIDSGPSQGSKTLFEIAPGPGQPDLRAGDKIRIVRQVDPKAAPDADPSLVTTYSFDDYARGLPLTIIGIVFAVVIIAVARWRGLRALLGLVVAFGVLVVFLLPALLDGKPAIPTALVAGAVILYAVLYLAHGVNLRTSSALLGTLSAMIVAAVLSWAALKMTHLTGFSEEQNTNVATYLQHVSITGLLLAGFIIGSLGVLNDVTITQASAAFELAELDEKATRRGIFAAAMRVGRDHIASTVYTLVLAYAGGALPLLMLFSVAGRSMRDVLTGDAVGIEIARSAVGGIALALSVPLTTAIAVLLARPPRTARAAAAAGGNRPRGGGAQRSTPRRPGGPRTGAQPAARRGGDPNGPRTGSQFVVRVGGDAGNPRTGSQPVTRQPSSGPGDGEPTVPRTGVVQPGPTPVEPAPANPAQFDGGAQQDPRYTTSSWFHPDEPWTDPGMRGPRRPPEPPRGGGRHSRPDS